MKFRYKVIIALILAVLLGSGVIFVVNKFSKNTLSGELEVFVNNDNYKYIKEVSEKFKEENPKVEIKLTSASNDSYQSKLKSKIKDKKYPDVALGTYDDINAFLEDGAKLSDFTDVVKTYKMNFSNRSLQEIYFDGVYRGVPFESYPIVMYLRQDLLKEYNYNYEGIKTWDDLISVGKKVYKKSDEKIKVLNGTGSDYRYLRSLLLMQNISKNNDLKKATEETDKFIQKLKKENILNTDKNHGFLARINSVSVADEIRDYDVKCEWTANDAPSMEIGGNRFFVEGGYNLISFEKDWKKNRLSKEFLVFITNDTETSLKYTLKGDICSSYLYTYKNKDIEKNMKNFIGKSPFVVMNNILEKAPDIKNYKKHESLNN